VRTYVKMLHTDKGIWFEGPKGRPVCLYHAWYYRSEGPLPGAVIFWYERRSA